jgi:hypothetical protein
MRILVNNKAVNFNHDDFPMLISGVDGCGTSFFSVCLMAELFNQGEKIVFFSAFPQAKDGFKKMIGDKLNDNAKIIENGDENLFIDVMGKTPDFNDRIVLFKNIDDYDDKLFNHLKDKKLVVFSGDVDKCDFSSELTQKEFKTKIFFSYPEKMQVEKKINLPKYNGMITSEKHNGLICVSI